MRSEEKNINELVSRTLAAAADTGRVEPSPFLKEKILNRIREEKETRTLPLLSWKIALPIAATIVLLLMNTFVIFSQKQENTGISSAKQDPIEVLAEEYGMVRSDYNY